MTFEFEVLLLCIDLLGTFIFGLSGGIMAVRKNLDLFGAAILALCAGLAGGIFRDVIIGQTPPATFQNSAYLLSSIIGGWVAFYAEPVLKKLNRPILFLDSFGLGLFAVSGCTIALQSGMNIIASVFLGVITAVGGGIVRDLLVREIPSVFKEDIYAVAAMFGAIVIVLGQAISMPYPVISTIALITVFSIRLLSYFRRWRLPKSPWSQGES